MAVCDPTVAGIDYLTDFAFIKAVYCTYVNAVGLLVAGTMTYFGIAGYIYIRTGSPIIPFGLLLLTGGAVAGQVAGPAMGIATVAVLLVGAGVVTAVYYRYAR